MVCYFILEEQKQALSEQKQLVRPRGRFSDFVPHQKVSSVDFHQQQIFPALVTKIFKYGAYRIRCYRDGLLKGKFIFLPS